MYPPGSVLDGKYRVERQLGSGGMGVIIAAEHLVLRTPVALKFLAERYVERADVVERFMREARASAALRSEHVCRVSDVGRLSTGVPYIVMELLEGKDLGQLLELVRTLPASTAADLVVQACDAIAEAHALGIVHRDLKPANLFLAQRRDGRSILKVLDFGVAKADSVSQPSLTQTENVVGSPTYMSPESLRSAKQADARSDIWSLGVILYELVIGEPPFTGTSIGDLAINIATEPLVQKPSSSPELDAIIARCLAKEPQDRFQTAFELSSALAPIALLRPRTPDPDAPRIRAVLDAPTPLELDGVPTDILTQPPRIQHRPLGGPPPRPSNEMTVVAPPIVSTPTPPAEVAATAVSMIADAALLPRVPPPMPALAAPPPPASQLRWGRLVLAGLAIVGIAVAIALIVAATGDEVPAATRPPARPPAVEVDAAVPMTAPAADASVAIDAAAAPADAEDQVAPADAAPAEHDVRAPGDPAAPPKKKPPTTKKKTPKSGDIGASRI